MRFSPLARPAGHALLALTLGLLAVAPRAWAQAAPSTAPAPAATASRPAEAPALLFAIEVRTGPAWDPAKRPQEQALFREHSVHLKRLRDEGRLLMGARYAEKGLLVLQAASEDEAHALIKADPSMQAGTFAYTLAEFRVFYGGTLTPPARRP